MTYDMAVWEGKQPVNDAAAGATYRRLLGEFIDSGDPVPPTPLLRAFVGDLLERWPDVTDGADSVDPPWAAGPLMDSASGPVIYICMNWDMCVEATEFIEERSRVRGLVCFNPQDEELVL